MNQEPGTSRQQPVSNRRCDCCGKSLRNERQIHVTFGEENEGLEQYVLRNRSRSNQNPRSNRVCHRCFVAYQRRASQDGEPNEDNGIGDAGFELSGYRRLCVTERQCIFNNCRGLERNRLSKDKRTLLLLEHSVFVADGARVCSLHQDYGFELLPDLRGITSTFRPEHVVEMLSLLKQKAKKRAKFIDFEFFEDMSDNDIHQWIGLTKDNFRDLLEDLGSLRTNRNRYRVVGAFLLKLRTGISNERIALMMNISRTTLQEWLLAARNAFLIDFVPFFLGFEAIDRDELLQHKTTVSEALFHADGKAITIWDATYCYIQKSSNYGFQRKSYSGQKKRNFLKPMLAVAPDGLILNAYGIHSANENDAQIMQYIYEHEDHYLTQYFQQGDIFLLDRGFRDNRPYLEHPERGYEVQIPAFLNPGARQLTTAQGNQSRFVSKCRNAVERVHGRIKHTFLYFAHSWQNTSIPHLMDDFRIACAIINRFFERLTSDEHDGAVIANRMLQLLHQENNLALLVEHQNFRFTQNTFRLLDGAVIEQFPVLSPEELRMFSLGSYQVKQALSYIADHRDGEGIRRIHIALHTERLPFPEFNIAVVDPLLVHAQIRSRHSNALKYHLFILVDTSKEGIEALKGHFCKCKNGRRTVGCCAHIMSVVFHLSYLRHQGRFAAPAAYLSDVLPTLESSDEDVKVASVK